MTNAFRYGGGKPVQVRLAQDGDCAVLAGEVAEAA